MKRLIFVVGMTLLVFGLVSVILRTNNQIELKQLDVKTKQAEINNLNKQIDELDKSDKSNLERVRELKKKNQELQSQLQAKRDREAREASNVVYAATVAPSNPTGNKAIAKAKAETRGWTGDQWNCLHSLWMRESGFNHLANNPSSGAYGIPQSLPASKMATVGADYLTNPRTQIEWGLNYIAGRYGTPCSAWAHSEAVNWY